MSTTSMHWAAAYVGKPWRRHARGPQAFSCWGLVQRAAEARLGLKMPDVAIDSDEAQLQQIFDAVRCGGWQQVTGAPRADDIVLMRNRAGERHCGYMVRNGSRLQVLHADGHDTPRGPVGGVVVQSLEDAIAGGYRDHEFWRHGQ